MTEFADLPLGTIVASTTNPRKTFHPERMAELAESIKATGVHTPVLVRPLPASRVQDTADMSPRPTFELVTGERRFRASQMAGRPSIPAMVRALTDDQVLEIQIIENLQRDDLHPLEEAEGYERLMQEKDKTGNPYTADTLGAEVGKSRTYIYNRLKLLALCDEAREAFYKGDLDASTAQLVARIPVKKLQLEALENITETAWRPTDTSVIGDKISFRKAREIVQEKFMLDLAKAPFDIKASALLAKAGSCTECPKRTGNQPELFDDVSSADVCTDTVCFGMKKAAHVLAIQKQAEAKGDKFILAKDSKKLIQSSWNEQEDLKRHGYAPLNTKVDVDGQHISLSKLLKDKKLLQSKGNTPPAVSLIHIERPNDPGSMIQTVSIEDATKALREIGYDITLKSKEDLYKEQRAQQDKEREQKKQAEADENAYRSRLLDALHARIETDMGDPNSTTFPMLYKRMAIALLDHDDMSSEDMAALASKYSPIPLPKTAKDMSWQDWRDHTNQFKQAIHNLAPQQHLMLVVEIVLMGRELTVAYDDEPPETMLALAKEFGIDAEALRKQVEAEKKPATAPAKRASARKTTPATPSPTEAEPAAKTVEIPQKVRPAATWPFPTPGKPEGGAA